MTDDWSRTSVVSMTIRKSRKPSAMQRFPEAGECHHNNLDRMLGFLVATDLLILPNKYTNDQWDLTQAACENLIEK